MNNIIFGLIILTLLIYGCTSPTQEANITDTKKIDATKNDVQKRTLKTSFGKAPDFELKDLNGKIVKLSDFKGKKVIINFFATWCSPCREEMLLFDKGYRTYKGLPEDIIFIGMNLQEDKETVKKFIKENDISFPILLDPESKARRSYKLITQPQTFFIDKEGDIVDKKIGPYTTQEFLEKFNAFKDQKIQQKPQVKKDEIKTKNGFKYIVDPNKITKVLSKDAIPSIQNPKFETTGEANKWLKNEDIGVGVSRNGVTRFYSFRILSRHEIVNDFFGNEPVIVTYCPLCRTAIAFNRQVDGQTLEFGVSGKLYNSEVVMFDRKTDSYWLQTPGKAVVGKLTGKVLKRLPSDVSTYGDWKSANPNTKVLSRDTGSLSVYRGDPYESYYTSDSVWYPVQAKSNLLGTKEFVLGITVNDVPKAYVSKKVKEKKLINDVIGGEPVLVLYDEKLKSPKIFSRKIDNKAQEFELKDGKILSKEGNVIDFNGNLIQGPNKGAKLENLAGIEHFWFSWYAFHPNTELYK